MIFLSESKELLKVPMAGETIQTPAPSAQTWRSGNAIFSVFPIDGIPS